MKTASVLSVLAALAALAASGADDVQVTYRGRLRAAGAAPAEQTLPMEFRLYAAKGSAEASWTMATNVLVDAQGLFQVALRGDGLAAAIDEGRARWIGVSVDGGKEQYPRQELLAAPSAEKAERADALAAGAEIGEADVGAVESKSLSVEAISIGGTSSIPVAGPVPTTVETVGQWFASSSTLSARGAVRFFSRANPITLAAATASGGGCSFGAASRNCVAVFAATGTDRMPAASMFFKKGEEIAVPAAAGLPDNAKVRCLVYPIGLE